ncbi:MAG TPA: MgtC/SapB family protein, partial [Blastocatellia bacterium]|nr:MgtC/SapB family protein [Blastocatellia bacterium]
MNELEILGRLAMSLVFGMIVGIERQWHHKNAGIKTNTLVSVGATAFALISLRGFGPTNNPAAIAAGVVTGIGFIGAGVIMRRGGSVQGINTAATLWAAGSMGLAIGAGYYQLAPALLVTIVIIQVALRPLSSAINKRSGLISALVTYHLRVTFHPDAANAVRAAWSDFAARSGVSVINYSESQAGALESALEASFGLSELRASEMNALTQKLAGTPGVTKAGWSQETTEEPE